MRTASLLALLAVTLPALVAPASAQTTFGVKLGINSATVSTNDEDLLFGFSEGDINGIEKRSRLGFVGGLTADVPLSPTFSFRPEILYTQKGFSIESRVDALDFESTQTLEIDYVEVPLLVAYRFPTQSALDVAVELGPTLAYKLSTGIGCSGDLEDLCDEGDVEDDEGIEDFDLGGALGVTVGSGPFGVGLRYTTGFLSIVSDEGAGSDDFSARNQVFTVTGHYRFGGR